MILKDQEMEEQEMLASIGAAKLELLKLDLGAASLDEVRVLRFRISDLMGELEVQTEGDPDYEWALALEYVQEAFEISRTWQSVPQELTDRAVAQLERAWDLQDDPSSELAWSFYWAAECMTECDETERAEELYQKLATAVTPGVMEGQ